MYLVRVRRYFLPVIANQTHCHWYVRNMCMISSAKSQQASALSWRPQLANTSPVSGIAGPLNFVSDNKLLYT